MTSNEPEKERRRDPRRPSKKNLVVHCRKGTLGLGPNLALAALNISLSGVQLRLKERLEPGQEIEVDLQTAEMNCRITVAADVIWCAAQGNDSFVVGAEFRKSLTYAELKELT
ncbi:MAG: PilZ domain-containing protein [Planctomycetes bacterium]|nr:PilZ domain-containing protein [Planctomycetota bacterium]